jgi:hypothetical protein
MKRGYIIHIPFFVWCFIVDDLDFSIFSTGNKKGFSLIRKAFYPDILLNAQQAI